MYEEKDRENFLQQLIYWIEHIVKRSFTAQCTDEFLHGPYKNQLVLDLNTKCGSELLYVRCELRKFATTIIFVIFLPSNFCKQKTKLFSSPHHLLFYNASYKGNILLVSTIFVQTKLMQKDQRLQRDYPNLKMS